MTATFFTQPAALLPDPSQIATEAPRAQAEPLPDLALEAPADLADFERFVHERYEQAYRFAYSLTGNDADASDLTQQSFFLAQTRQHQLREAGKGKQWLFTIIHHEFLRSRRSQGVRERHKMELTHQGSTPIRVDHAASLDAKALLPLLDGLDEAFRVPLSLFYFEQLSYKEIAEALAIPIGTVMSRLARAKGMLRQALEQTPPAPKNVPPRESGVSSPQHG